MPQALTYLTPSTKNAEHYMETGSPSSILCPSKLQLKCGDTFSLSQFPTNLLHDFQRSLLLLQCLLTEPLLLSLEVPPTVNADSRAPSCQFLH